MALFFIEALHRCTIVDDGDDDIAVVAGGLFFHGNIIAIVDPDFDHGIAAHLQEERTRISHDFDGEGDCFRYVLLGKNGQTRGNIANNRKRNHIGKRPSANRLKLGFFRLLVAANDGNASRFQRVTVDIALFFKRFQMHMNGRRRGEA